MDLWPPIDNLSVSRASPSADMCYQFRSMWPQKSGLWSHRESLKSGPLHEINEQHQMQQMSTCLRDLQDGVSGGYLCATSHIIYEMGSQGGTCVQLHTSSMRWGLRGYLCATSHIIYEMGSRGGTCVQLHTSSMRWGLRGYLCATSHIIHEMGSQGGTCVQLHTSSMRWGCRGVLVCNFTHHL